jgi:hypothetical protein
MMPQRFPYSEREAVRHYVKLFLTAIGMRQQRTPAVRGVKNAARR